MLWWITFSFFRFPVLQTYILNFHSFLFECNYFILHFLISYCKKRKRLCNIYAIFFGVNISFSFAVSFIGWILFWTVTYNVIFFSPTFRLFPVVHWTISVGHLRKSTKRKTMYHILVNAMLQFRNYIVEKL